MRRTSPERRAVVELLEGTGETSPQEIATALGRSPGSTRQLLSGMLDDGLVITRGRGRYCLPADDNPDFPTPKADNQTRQPDANPDVNPYTPEPRIGKPKSGQIFAYIAADEGMIPNELLRARKGYR
jgi:DNA-binding transcriptional ArsR family regulator